MQLCLFNENYYDELHKAKCWRSFDNKILEFEEFLVNRKGQVYSTKTNQFLKVSINYHRGGYCQVALTNSEIDKEISYKLKRHHTKRSHRKNFYVHRLVACTFITNPDKKKYTIVNHIDENPQNNHITNLEWVTPTQNTRKHYELKSKNQFKLF